MAACYHKPPDSNVHLSHTYLAGCSVAFQFCGSSGSSSAYGPPSFTSTSRNWMCPGSPAMLLLCTGAIQQSLILATAMNALPQMSPRLTTAPGAAGALPLTSNSRQLLLVLLLLEV